MAMWRPAARIRHDAQAGTWPTAVAASGSRLFQSIAVGCETLHERTWVPAMVPWRAGVDGQVNANVLDWYRRFAEGRPWVDDDNYGRERLTISR